MTRLTLPHVFTIMTTLWAVSFTLMVVQTIVGGETYLGQWAILVALGACVASGSAIIRIVSTEVACRERLRVQEIADLIAAKMRTEEDVDRIY